MEFFDNAHFVYSLIPYSTLDSSFDEMGKPHGQEATTTSPISVSGTGKTRPARMTAAIPPQTLNLRVSGFGSRV